MQSIIHRRAEELTPRLVEIRRDLHQHPELSFEEFRTAEIVAGILQELGLEITTGVAKTGVVGLLRGAEQGRTVALRADIDALPMHENTGLPYASVNSGVMHACGHDVHTSILLGVAMILAEMRDRLAGAVKFIFQPAEEGSRSGAKAMVAEQTLDNPKVDAVFGLHIFPAYPSGTMHIKPGIWMAATAAFEMTVRGRTAHATAPHLSVDATVITAQVISALQAIAGRQIDPREPVVISFVSIHGGPEAFGSSIVGEVKLSGLLRAYSADMIKEIRGKMKTVAGGVALGMGGSCEFNFLDGCPQGINDEKLSELMMAAGRKVLGEDRVVVESKVDLGGEDFTFFAEQVPGCFVFLGAQVPGTSAALHTPDCVVNEDVIPPGVRLMCQTAVDYLNGG